MENRWTRTEDLRRTRSFPSFSPRPDEEERVLVSVVDTSGRHSITDRGGHIRTSSSV